MTEKEKLNHDYFNWILQLVHDGNISTKRSYFKLMSRLYDTRFTYMLDMDSNRSADGIELRYRFCHDCNIEEWIIDELLDDKPCSILEMMAALSLRCEENIMIDSDEGKRIGRWFWGMINSLGLIDMDDDHYDDIYVTNVINCFLERKYERTGKGGLFTIEDCVGDLRKVEIWYQLCWYLDTIS